MANQAATKNSPDLITHIKDLYHAYRHTVDIDRKGLFFSPTCIQICRTTPSYATTTREGIVQYLKDAQQGIVPVESSSLPAAVADTSKTLKAAAKGEENETPRRGVYTIRPLQPFEYDFSNDETTAPVGLTADQLRQKAEEENWIGMRVDLWEEGAQQEGLLVKVHYWWRRESIPTHERLGDDEDAFGWRQCLHDIMYLGPKDGTEGAAGLSVLT